jgi:hypothetical protein
MLEATIATVEIISVATKAPQQIRSEPMVLTKVELQNKQTESRFKRFRKICGDFNAIQSRLFESISKLFAYFAITLEPG